MIRTLHFVLTGLLPLFFTQGIGAQGFDEVEMVVHSVAGDVKYIEGRGGNIGLLAGDEGVLLIDDQYAPLTDKILEAIRTVSDQPVKFIINTHMHPDHTGGNENFGRIGALIIGHENVRSQMAIAGYKQTPPFVTFSENVTFHINNEIVHAFKVPNAHTNNDSYIKFENANVIHTGDVYRSTSYPYVDTNNGGSFVGIIQAHELLVEISDEDTKIIPGHGNITEVDQVREVLEMLYTVRIRVKKAIKNKLTLEQTQSAGLTTEFDERWDSGGRIGGSKEFIRAAFADMNGN